MELAPFLTDLTPAGILGLVVVMILLGWLVPARMVRTIVAGKDALIAEQKAHIETQARALDAALRGNTATEAVVTATAEIIETQARALDAALRGNTATEAVLTATAEIQHRSGVGDGQPAE